MYGMMHPNGYLQSFRSQQGKYLPIVLTFMNPKNNMVEEYRPGKTKFDFRNVFEISISQHCFLLKLD